MNYLPSGPFVAHTYQPDDEILPGVRWGRSEWFPSPAFWASLANQKIDYEFFRRPDSLRDEVAFCLLGGYGVTAESNCAAFNHLKSHGVFEATSSSGQIEALLRQPLSVNGSRVRYRFPAQRALRLSNAFRRLADYDLSDLEPLALRDKLLSFEGIGPKTASWITRNWTGSSDVAIIDIHVHRAGRRMGLYSSSLTLPRDYFEMERRFLQFADRIAVSASVLDVLIWSTMRKVGPYREVEAERKNGQRRRKK